MNRGGHFILVLVIIVVQFQLQLVSQLVLLLPGGFTRLSECASEGTSLRACRTGSLGDDVAKRLPSWTERTQFRLLTLLRGRYHVVLSARRLKYVGALHRVPADRLDHLDHALSVHLNELSEQRIITV